MRFEQVYGQWNAGRLTQAEAGLMLGMCERSFRRYLLRYEADGLEVTGYCAALYEFARMPGTISPTLPSGRTHGRDDQGIQHDTKARAVARTHRAAAGQRQDG